MYHDPVRARLAQLPARDPVAALTAAGGDADLAAELFAALAAGLPEELNELRADLAEGDWVGLAEHAHQMRGATRYCGVPALDEATEALERAARIEDPVLIAQAFANLEEETLRVQTAG
ncbi:Hpt domain-containing protein [Lamprocystis purpurea]|uniref:Hpt domain-containing protein n=1 Tax=Lamprocystis purpurea TaxID=61598 RepID=UPI0003710FA2|nr:Hpt domain-containing protein [Lamprocystis purpurea]